MNIQPEPRLDVTTALALRGFRILQNAITPDAEQVMIDRIIAAFGKTPVRSNENDRSRIMRYGYDYTLEEKLLRPAPEWLYHPPVTPDQFESVTVNEYLSGHGITPHIDSLAFGNEIFILNLGSSATMGLHPSPNNRHEVFIPRRSLTLLSGEVRSCWQHSIPSRTSDLDPDGNEVQRTTRYSVVYRHRRGKSAIDAQKQ